MQCGDSLTRNDPQLAAQLAQYNDKITWKDRPDASTAAPTAAADAAAVRARDALSKRHHMSICDD